MRRAPSSPPPLPRRRHFEAQPLLRDGAGQRPPLFRTSRRSRRLPPPHRSPGRRRASLGGVRCPSVGCREPPPRARPSPAARDHHAGLQVRGRRDGGGGLARDGGFLHRLADGAEGDRDQPLPAGHHGGRGGRLQFLGTPLGPPVPRLRATQQRAHLGSRRFEIVGQHGLPVQGDGAQHGHHDLRLGQEGTRSLLRGQRRDAGAGPGLRRRFGFHLRLRGAGPRSAPRFDAGGRLRPGAPRHLPGGQARRLFGGTRHRLSRRAGRLAPRLRRQHRRPAGTLRRRGGSRLNPGLWWGRGEIALLCVKNK